MKFVAIVANCFTVERVGSSGVTMQGFQFCNFCFSFIFFCLFIHIILLFMYIFFFQNYYLHSMYSLKIFLNPVALVKYICCCCFIFKYFLLLRISPLALHNGDFLLTSYVCMYVCFLVQEHFLSLHIIHNHLYVCVCV